ncbi:hypothetical protein RhiirA4_478176 [Rhizophagus irregularis]|uniref:Uncharacterized protein n=1 Tax=Rhizophagus irregularis TaxID=588596 RepID=A0A2I1HED6_9GLOM|nr:hypothetical protein RhiirA4_478176 [Rhizophagus irregularis]
MADAEASKGLDILPISINLKLIPDAIMVPMWDSIGPIDKDIRKFCKNITEAKIFDSFTNNSKLQTFFARHSLSEINWTFTKLWLAHNETNSIYSSEKSKKDAFKLKSLNHILPCGDVLSAHYPSLYNPDILPIKCPICKTTDDSNQHLDQSHLIYLIIHNVVPDHLVTLIHTHTRNFKLTKSFVMDFMTHIQQYFYTSIWCRHTESMVAWEKHTGIHAKKTKMRRAKRRAQNKKKFQRLPTSNVLPLKRLRNHHLPCNFAKFYDARGHYDDRLRINYFQCDNNSDLHVPRWIILTS